MHYFLGSKKLLPAALVALCLLTFPVRATAAPPSWSVGLGAEFASGDYGTGIRTDSVYMPFTVAVKPTERLDFSLEIPFVYQSSSAVVAGQFMGMQSMGIQSASSTMRTAAAMGPLGATGPGPRTNAAAGSIGDAQYGLGDVKLRGGYVLFTEEEYLPAIRPNFYLKFPTADKDKFLGTGAFDGGFALELFKWRGDWLADAEAGYAIQGHSTVVAVKDYFYYSAGVGYQLTERFRPMVIVKGSTPTVEGASALAEVRLRAKYQLTNHTGIDGYLAKGITTSSPEYGMGLAVFYAF
jgi:hypothetical protein